MHEKSFAKKIESNYFVKILLVVTFEPRIFLFFSWNLAYLSLDAVVLQFLRN